MKKLIPLTLLSIGLNAAHASPECPRIWKCETVEMEVPYNYGKIQKKASVRLRAGYIEERAPFKGNVIYYQGLGDSMINQAPLFELLADSGFRVISFDYMGQGGSEGKMNNTRIHSIPLIGQVVWKRFAKDLKNHPQKNIIGWSTGGLAGWLQAIEGSANKVALIAPGILPKKIVGEGLPFNKITLRTLTGADYGFVENPHLDPIRPTSPLLVPAFSIDLLSSAASLSKRSASSKTQGLVLLGGDDSYVKSEKTVELLKTKAPHFDISLYSGARHEIQNEAPEIAEPARLEILNFLLR